MICTAYNHDELNSTREGCPHCKPSPVECKFNCQCGECDRPQPYFRYCAQELQGVAHCHYAYGHKGRHSWGLEKIAKKMSEDAGLVDSLRASDSEEYRRVEPAKENQMDFENVDRYDGIKIPIYGEWKESEVVLAATYNQLLSAYLELKRSSDLYREALMRLRELYGEPGE